MRWSNVKNFELAVIILRFSARQRRIRKMANAVVILFLDSLNNVVATPCTDQQKAVKLTPNQSSMLMNRGITEIIVDLNGKLAPHKGRVLDYYPMDHDAVKLYHIPSCMIVADKYNVSEGSGIVMVVEVEPKIKKFNQNDIRTTNLKYEEDTRCQIPGKRKELVVCRKKCDANCPYFTEREERSRKPVSYGILEENGYEAVAKDNTEETVISKMMCEGFYESLKDDKHANADQVAEGLAKGDKPTEIAADLGMKDQTVYSTCKALKKPATEYFK